jgi:hypothetical protein
MKPPPPGPALSNQGSHPALAANKKVGSRPLNRATGFKRKKYSLAMAEKQGKPWGEGLPDDARPFLGVDAKEK